MNRTTHIQLMAEYNKAMNHRLFALAETLPAETLSRNVGAFFGSILGTLNHLAVGDTIWLKRLAMHGSFSVALRPVESVATPTRLDEQLFAALTPLAQYRQWLDGLIVEFSQQLSDESLDVPLSYVNTKGVASSRDMYGVLAHFFNHQTHHRGQVTTLLNQAGIDPGVTDLLVLLPELR